MSSKTRNVALLLPAFVLATGLAHAQPGVKVSTVNQDGTVTSNTFTATTGGPAAKAPTPAPDGSAKYWDGLGLGGASTNYFTQVPYIVQQPIPSIAAGPDDILTIVNRTIARYANPNAAGNTQLGQADSDAANAGGKGSKDTKTPSTSTGDSGGSGLSAAAAVAFFVFSGFMPETRYEHPAAQNDAPLSRERAAAGE